MLHSGAGIGDVATVLGMHYVNASVLLAWLVSNGHAGRDKGRKGRYRYWATQATERFVMAEVAGINAEAARLLEGMLLHPLCKRDRVRGLLGL
jgi:hypothetical protein